MLLIFLQVGENFIMDWSELIERHSVTTSLAYSFVSLEGEARSSASLLTAIKWANHPDL